MTREKRGRLQKRGEIPPDKSEPPGRKCAIVSDTTIEATAAALGANPRGVLVLRDEIAAWIGSFDAYTGASKDAQGWLELYRGGTLKVNRKTSKPIRVKRAAASVTGTIQPAILKRIMAGHIEDGLLARFVLTMPPRRRNRWTEAHVSDATSTQLDKIFDHLAAIDFMSDEPGTLGLDSESKAAWIDWYHEHSDRQADATGALAYSLAKIQEIPARLALTLQLVDNPAASKVSIEPMRIGIELGRWFAYESARIYATWSEDKKTRELRDLFDHIRARGGRITVRDLQRGPRIYRESGKAERLLQSLVKAGLARVEHKQPDGPGRPCDIYILQGPTPGDGDTIQKIPRKSANVSPSPPLEVRENTTSEPVVGDISGSSLDTEQDLEMYEPNPGDGDTSRKNPRENTVVSPLEPRLFSGDTKEEPDIDILARVLDVVENHDRHTPEDIAMAVGLNAVSVLPHLERLEAAGKLTRDDETYEWRLATEKYSV